MYDRPDFFRLRKQVKRVEKFFNPFPKYLQIRYMLVQRLITEYAPGDRFPTEKALSEEFGVSRETVREALSGLEEQGLIARVPGRGTTVKRRPRGQPEQRLTGLVEDFTELKLNTITRILGKEVWPAESPIAEELEVPIGEPLYLIRRLRYLDGKPLAIHEAYLPMEFGVPLGRLDLTRSTISQELRTRFSPELREDFQTIDAIVASPRFAEQLQISVGAPILIIRRRYLGCDGRPVAYFISWFRTDRYYATIKFPSPKKENSGTNSPLRSSPANGAATEGQSGR